MKNGDLPVILRITVDGKRVEIMFKRGVPAELWDQKKECSRRKDQQARELNLTIQTMRAKLVNIYHDMLLHGKTITVKTICETFSGKDRKTKSLFAIYEDHNMQFRSLVGIDYAESIANKFDTSLLRLREYVSHQYGKEDFEISDVDGTFIHNFDT